MSILLSSVETTDDLQCVVKSYINKISYNLFLYTHVELHSPSKHVQLVVNFYMESKGPEIDTGHKTLNIKLSKRIDDKTCTSISDEILEFYNKFFEYEGDRLV
jgi:hypothetical protein